MVMNVLYKCDKSLHAKNDSGRQHDGVILAHLYE